MICDTDNIKAGDWVQIANGDWYVFINWDGAHAHIGKYTRKGVLGSCGLVLPWPLTSHLTSTEVEANGLPVSDKEIVEYVFNECLVYDGCGEDDMLMERKDAVKAIQSQCKGKESK